MHCHILSYLVDCVWAPWGEFSPCDKFCGGGMMYRTRYKYVTEQYGGSCPGGQTDEKACNTDKCPGKISFNTLKRGFDTLSTVYNRLVYTIPLFVLLFFQTA